MEYLVPEYYSPHTQAYRNNRFPERVLHNLPVSDHLRGRSYDHLTCVSPKSLSLHYRTSRTRNRSPSSPTILSPSPPSPDWMSHTTFNDNIYPARDDRPRFRNRPGEPIEVVIVGSKTKRRFRKGSTKKLYGRDHYATATQNEYADPGEPHAFCIPIHRPVFHRPTDPNRYNEHVTNMKVARNILNDIVTKIFEEQKLKTKPRRCFSYPSNTQTYEQDDDESASTLINTNTEEGISEPETLDDWLDEVRELCDSHVHLVKQKLRHVMRLNRALDRVIDLNFTPASPTIKVNHIIRCRSVDNQRYVQSNF